MAGRPNRLGRWWIDVKAGARDAGALLVVCPVGAVLVLAYLDWNTAVVHGVSWYLALAMLGGMLGLWGLTRLGRRVNARMHQQRWDAAAEVVRTALLAGADAPVMELRAQVRALAAALEEQRKLPEAERWIAVKAEALINRRWRLEELDRRWDQRFFPFNQRFTLLVRQRAPQRWASVAHWTTMVRTLEQDAVLLRWRDDLQVLSREMAAAVAA